MTRLFNRRSLEESQLSFSRYLPSGDLFKSKDSIGKGLYSFLEGISKEAIRINDTLTTYNDEFYPDSTELFIEEWERALGLPDSCISIEGVSREDRRRNILQKLAGFHIQTDQEFEDLATAFGLSATVLAGKDPLVSPVITPDKTARFTIVIQFTVEEVFPYTFPIVFGSSAIEVLECIFDKLKPANCQVLFEGI